MQDSNSFPFLDTPITFGARSQKLPKLLWVQARRSNQGFHQAQTLEYCSGTWFSTNPAITTAVARQRGTWYILTPLHHQDEQPNLELITYPVGLIMILQ